ncbi:Gfo/Idh/MocA family protein [Paenarthrobacter ureafaciens]|uniref:Gfo/Idh/MocA family protein n=1 Tax=Paenarthrobacter ureafaciens TaxID=37931 RepID=UPI0014079543|nr:Gfo/Idh/MocA family oxidoreductase [Paenarthrobacter ureafaciens]MCX8456367.1 Gfo/Idh/MocA family oxidoreductase [Paenarthrobacter ureafaciens]MCY0971997.1 Gfo/Idh/MocA family oxidoreductase [Paenarthrobacter ureafaciens]
MTTDINPEPLKVAFIGTGGIAHAHAEALRSLPGVDLAVAIDVDLPRAREFASKFGISRTATSLQKAMEEGNVDLAAICTPPASHHPLAMEALALGLHAVIEKPPALSLRQMRELEATEAASAGTISCIFQHRFGSGAQRLLAMRKSGVLGRPLVGTCNTLWFRNQAYFDVPWRGQWDIEGGGPTMGHGIHQFDLLLHLWGPWSDVTAFAGKLARRTNTEDISAAIVRFDSGAIATVINSVISPRETSYLRLDFENATVELEHLYGYQDSNWTLTAAPGTEGCLEAWNHGEDLPSGHTAQYGNIVDRIRKGLPPESSISKAYATMELAAAIYASSVSGDTYVPGDIGEDSPFFDRMDGHLEPWNELQGARA